MLIATGYFGLTISGGRIPWAALVAIVLFVTGFVLPLILEHRRLGSGFTEIENTYRTRRHRELNPPDEEIFSPATPLQLPERPHSYRKIIIACAITAIFFLGLDIADTVINQPLSAIPEGSISNY